MNEIKSSPNEKLLSEHRASMKEYLRKKRSDSGEKRDSYTKILHPKFRSLISIANRRGIHVKITQDEFLVLIKMNCVYCGSCSHIGVDRIDSNQDYSTDNVCPCCKICNWMKHQLPQENFISHISKIYKFQQSKITEIKNENGPKQ